MRNVVIVEAARTPVGRFRGGLKTVRADHLGAAVLGALVARAGITPDQVDDVVFGCVSQVGEQCGNIARTALLSADWPASIPGMTVDRKCGSAEAAVHVAVGAIASGASDTVVAGGAESMTRVPMGGNRDVHGVPFGWRVADRRVLLDFAKSLCVVYWSLVETLHIAAAEMAIQADGITNRSAPEFVTRNAVDFSHDVPKCDIDASDGG